MSEKGTKQTLSALSRIDVFLNVSTLFILLTLYCLVPGYFIPKNLPSASSPQTCQVTLLNSLYSGGNVLRSS